jgi:hypothetical protein
LKYESIKFDEIKVHAYGDTAVVTAGLRRPAKTMAKTSPASSGTQEFM